MDYVAVLELPTSKLYEKWFKNISQRSFITDIVGFLGLIPTIRQTICAHFLPKSKNPTVRKSDANENSRTIEGRYTIDED